MFVPVRPGLFWFVPVCPGLFLFVSVLTCLSPLEFKVKKGGWGPFTSGGSRQIQFSVGQGDEAVLKPSGKVLQVSIGPGLPQDSRPTRRDNRKSRYISPAHNPAPNSSSVKVRASRHHGAQDKRMSRGRSLRQSSMEQPSLPRFHGNRQSIVLPQQPEDRGFMDVPETGAAGLQRRKSKELKPDPGQGRPKPSPKPRPERLTVELSGPTTPKTPTS
ncbi:hypothetical protein WMY93_033055 [Mugilogobius chulae]|uniref:Uncharacterized protein n=1 Tax=Mugilogobius chulae TaxID=88201 RepID=A0AAW0MI47_9GOBI